MSDQRATELFDQHKLAIHTRTDRTFGSLLVVQYIFGIFAAFIIAPETWTGSQSAIHVHVLAAIFLGGLIISYPLYLIRNRPGQELTRHVVAVSQMLFSALLIHLTGGRIETHFHIFGSLAFLAFYRDWKVLISASIVVMADHILRGVFWPASVYGTLSSGSWRWMEHTGWVIFEDTFLIWAIRQSTDEMWAIAKRQTEAEEKETSLRRSELGFRSIFELAGSGKYVVCAKTGQFLRVNPKFAEYTGYSEQELLGMKLFDIVPQIDRDSRESFFAKIASGEIKNFSGERKYVRKDGTEFWVLATATIPYLFKDEAPRIIATIQDISKLKETEAELEEAKLRAEDANSAKTAFLANMSHEIRTPLGAMLGFAQLMSEDANANPEQQQHLKTILRNGDQLFRVINDILDISKVEANKLDIEKIRFDLKGLIDDVIVLLSLKAEEKGLGLSIHAVGPLPDTIVSDPTRLKQILTNMIGNAIKFTAKGKVEVFFTLRNEGKSQLLEIRVSDTGLGISKENARKLFQPFMQADSATSRKYGGTGLGLYLSRRLAQELGGDVSLESSSNEKGSTFTITIDAGLSEKKAIFTNAVSTDQIIRPGFRKSPKDTLEGVRVLVVDDSPDNLQIAYRFLKAASATVECSESALHAIERITKERFDVVLMDIQMPGLDGYEAVAKMRSEMNYRKPILALTAHAMRGEKERCLEAGFDSYLVKPIDRTALVSAVRKFADFSHDREPAPPDSNLSAH